MILNYEAYFSSGIEGARLFGRQLCFGQARLREGCCGGQRDQVVTEGSAVQGVVSQGALEQKCYWIGAIAMNLEETVETLAMVGLGYVQALRILLVRRMGRQVNLP